MRTKKALINSSANILCFIIAFIPSLIIRKIFLDTLGSDILGLNSLYNNIIGWLSIVELGVGTAIIYSLYKPFADNDRSQIRAYIRFYGKFYRSVGFVILIIGLIITPFLKYFIKENIDLKLGDVDRQDLQGGVPEGDPRARARSRGARLREGLPREEP